MDFKSYLIFQLKQEKQHSTSTRKKLLECPPAYIENKFHPAADRKHTLASVHVFYTAICSKRYNYNLSVLKENAHFRNNLDN